MRLQNYDSKAGLGGMMLIHAVSRPAKWQAGLEWEWAFKRKFNVSRDYMKKAITNPLYPLRHLLITPFNSMLALIVRYPIPGIRENPTHGIRNITKKLTRLMLEGGRKDWNNPKLAYLLVQLAHFIPQKVHGRPCGRHSSIFCPNRIPDSPPRSICAGNRAHRLRQKHREPGTHVFRKSDRR